MWYVENEKEVKRKGNVLAVYIIDVSRDCFLRDIAIASPSKIFLSVMRPWDFVWGKRAKYGNLLLCFN